MALPLGELSPKVTERGAMPNLTIFNFTGVYDRMYGGGAENPASSLLPHCDTEWVNLKDLRGTDGYLDEFAADEIRKRIREIRAESWGAGNDSSVTERGVSFPKRLIDNGNHHYMSALLMEDITEDFVLLLLDHHPDMQPPAIGNLLSCGGWVYDSLMSNERLKGVVIAGADEGLYREAAESLENALPVGDPGELTDRIFHIPEGDLSSEAVEKALLEAAGGRELPVYISVDKDILNIEEIRTTWDQGDLKLSYMEDILSRITDSFRVLAMDICGEPSFSAPEADVEASRKVNLSILS